MATPKNPLLMPAYVALFGIWALSYFYAIDMSVNVVATATLIVYIGSHRSLRLLATEEEGGYSKESKEVMSSADAGRRVIRLKSNDWDICD